MRSVRWTYQIQNWWYSPPVKPGLGDIEGNEGVYGLQRAFRIAGARYLIMSLWQVPDKETMEFMETFYRNWLEKAQPIPKAFRITQKEMREKYKDPYAWAGLRLAGISPLTIKNIPTSQNCNISTLANQHIITPHTAVQPSVANSSTHQS